MIWIPRRSVLRAFFVLISITALGTLGYTAIEDAPFLDALYMTIVTMSTVGFQEVFPLSTTGRLFTIGLIVFGVGVALYLLAVIAEQIMEGQLEALADRAQLSTD